MSSIAHNEQHHSRYGPVRAFFARLLTRWQRERTRAVLESLGDDLFRNVGITRGEIPYVADRLTRPVAEPKADKREDAWSDIDDGGRRMMRSTTELSNRDPASAWERQDHLSPEVFRAFAIARWEDDGGRVFDAGVAGITASMRQGPHDIPSWDHQWSVS